jgi:hypothetical protein
MERIYVFLIRNDTWIYILSTLGLFWYTSEFIRAQRSLRSAVFGLERERGVNKRNNALVFMSVFAAALSITYFVNFQIAPDLPPGLLRPPTPTPSPLMTPLSPPTPLGTPGTERTIVTPDLVATVTLPGQPGAGADGSDEGIEQATLTPTVYVPPTPFIGCNVELNISDPRNGAAVRGDISFFGTADTENFGAYVMETNGPETAGQWASLLGRRITQPVREGFLGNANLSMWDPGPYLVRLTTEDTQGNIVGQCVIQVTLTGGS